MVFPIFTVNKRMKMSSAEQVEDPGEAPLLQNGRSNAETFTKMDRDGTIHI